MRLTVEVSGSNSKDSTHTVSSFKELDKIATRVASDVKRWLRAVPLRKQGSRLVVELNAGWSEREAKK